MAKPIWEFDEVRTARRIRNLARYYDQHVLADRKFVCPWRRLCKSSLNGDLNFYVGRLSHVGKRYDLKMNGKDLRVVVTGIEYGSAPAKVNMTRRYSDIVKATGVRSEFYANHDTERGKRNPHMRGTTLLLKRILLGKESVNTARYSSWEEEFIEKPRIAKNHIFNMFALVNFLLCSAVQDNTQGRSTSQMRKNCARHYIESLKILEPNLVIFQGKGLFRNVLKNLDLSHCWNPRTDTLGIFKSEGLRFVTCDFFHPSYRGHDRAWSNPKRPYFKDSVLPTLQQALQELGVEQVV